MIASKTHEGNHSRFSNRHFDFQYQSKFKAFFILVHTINFNSVAVVYDVIVVFFNKSSVYTSIFHVDFSYQSYHHILLYMISRNNTVLVWCVHKIAVCEVECRCYVQVGTVLRWNMFRRNISLSYIPFMDIWDKT